MLNKCVKIFGENLWINVTVFMFCDEKAVRGPVFQSSCALNVFMSSIV